MRKQVFAMMLVLAVSLVGAGQMMAQNGCCMSQEECLRLHAECMTERMAVSLT